MARQNLGKEKREAAKAEAFIEKATSLSGLRQDIRQAIAENVTATTVYLINGDPHGELDGVGDAVNVIVRLLEERGLV